MKYLKLYECPDLLLEKMINESVLYFSEPLRKRLSDLSSSSKIAAKLLELEGTDVHSSDVTFVDISKEVGFLTFMPMDKAIAKLKAVHPDVASMDLQNNPNIRTNDILYKKDISGKYGIYGDNRDFIKVGRFVKKVFGDKLTYVEIEDFVNQFKSKQELTHKVELVSGDKIAHWYDIKNYDLDFSGTLRSSCMASVPSGFFDIYTKNPEVCRLAILKNGDKLLARALVWKVDSSKNIQYYKDMISNKNIKNIQYYMDRIYYTKDHYQNILMDYAKEQGWGIYGYISSKMKVKVNNIEYKEFPYMDTFRRYDYTKGYLYNDHDKEKRGDILLSVAGGASRNTRSKIQRFKDFLTDL